MKYAVAIERASEGSGAYVLDPPGVWLRRTRRTKVECVDVSAGAFAPLARAAFSGREWLHLPR